MSKSPLKIFLLVLTLVLLLLPLHWLPVLTLGNYEVKRISILSDVIPEEKEEKSDTSLIVPLPPAKSQPENVLPEKVCPKGGVQILDYDEGQGRGMRFFYEALHRRMQMGRPVRIAYLGDSFIESDLMTASLREKLQKKFGGHGVGYLDMAPPYASMRMTVRQRYAGWKESSILEKGSFSSRYLNISQRYFQPDSIAWTEVRGVPLFGLDSADVHTLYLCTSSPHRISVRLDKNPVRYLESDGSERVEALSAVGRSHKTHWEVSSGNDVKCFGIAEESRTGLILDNLSLRGSSGMQMNALSEANMKQWNDVRPYDLIVLQYGLNVASKKQTNYAYYVAQMKRVIGRLKNAFPQASILVVGVGDRGARDVTGEITTMPGIVELMRYQQKLSADTQVAFWNLYEAMGGEGAMKCMAEKKPAEAAKDYTHITKVGGQRLSDLLFNSIVYGYEQFK